MLKILKKEELGNEIAVVVGTRPGIIKFSPIIRELKLRELPFFIIHTGQHYSFNMDRQFFEDLDLPAPRYINDKVCKETYHGAQTAEMIRGVEDALIDSKPRLVIVGGDANTNLAAALATRKLCIKLVHMEAGLRSHDWQMPEEHNRVIIDHISEILLPPTTQAMENLLKDNVRGEIHVVGNPIVDAVYQNEQIASEKSRILEKHGLYRGEYILCTLHREENVDHQNILTTHITNLKKVGREQEKKIIFPVHPRTRNRLKQFGLWDELLSDDRIGLIDPVGYLDFILLIKNAKLILTDSGGIQEEACILRVPCLTLRENTERPETIEVGANELVGYNLGRLRNGIAKFSSKDYNWHNPFGDGSTASKIVDIIAGNWI